MKHLLETRRSKTVHTLIFDFCIDEESEVDGEVALYIRLYLVAVAAFTVAVVVAVAAVTVAVTVTAAKESRQAELIDLPSTKVRSIFFVVVAVMPQETSLHTQCTFAHLIKYPSVTKLLAPKPTDVVYKHI